VEKITENEELLTRYLLGELTEAENSRLEERYFADNSLYDELGALERDLIDRYVQIDLSDYEKEQFEKHFLSTPKRQQKLNFARALNSYILKETERSEPSYTAHKQARQWFLFPVSSLKLAASIIIVLGLAFGIWRVLLYHSQLDKGLVALNKAYDNQRPFQARISGTSYKPQLIKRGNEQKSGDKNIDIAVGLLADAVVEESSFVAHHALGKAYLMRSEFDKAIDEFEEALNIGGASAQLYNDLGAALLERGKTYGEKDGSKRAVEDFSASLAHLSKAYAMDSSLLDALFNRALCYKALNYKGGGRESQIT
jgi:tetratricopeptide (TPR) repeat protein